MTKYSFGKMWDFFHKFIQESENLDCTIIEPSMSIERSWASQKLLFCLYTLAHVLSLELFFSVNCFPFLLFLFPPSLLFLLPSLSHFLPISPFLHLFLSPSFSSVSPCLPLSPSLLRLPFLSVFFSSSACLSVRTSHFQTHVWVSSPQFTHLFPDFFSSPPVYSLVLAKSPCQFFFTMPDNKVNAFFRLLIQWRYLRYCWQNIFLCFPSA